METSEVLDIKFVLMVKTLLLLKMMTFGQQKIMWLLFEDGHVSSVFRISAYKLDRPVQSEPHAFDFDWNEMF